MVEIGRIDGKSLVPCVYRCRNYGPGEALEGNGDAATTAAEHQHTRWR
jgi:hypothetical protein